MICFLEDCQIFQLMQLSLLVEWNFLDFEISSFLIKIFFPFIEFINVFPIHTTFTYNFVLFYFVYYYSSLKIYYLYAWIINFRQNHLLFLVVSFIAFSLSSVFVSLLSLAFLHFILVCYFVSFLSS